MTMGDVPLLTLPPQARPRPLVLYTGNHDARLFEIESVGMVTGRFVAVKNVDG